MDVVAVQRIRRRKGIRHTHSQIGGHALAQIVEADRPLLQQPPIIALPKGRLLLQDRGELRGEGEDKVAHRVRLPTGAGRGALLDFLTRAVGIGHRDDRRLGQRQRPATSRAQHDFQ